MRSGKTLTRSQELEDLEKGVATVTKQRRLHVCREEVAHELYAERYIPFFPEATKLDLPLSSLEI
jgi:hypothetical protein